MSTNETTTKQDGAERAAMALTATEGTPVESLARSLEKALSSGILKNDKGTLPKPVPVRHLKHGVAWLDGQSKNIDKGRTALVLEDLHEASEQERDEIAALLYICEEASRKEGRVKAEGFTPTEFDKAVEGLTKGLSEADAAAVAAQCATLREVLDPEVASFLLLKGKAVSAYCVDQERAVLSGASVHFPTLLFDRIRRVRTSHCNGAQTGFLWTLWTIDETGKPVISAQSAE